MPMRFFNVPSAFKSLSCNGLIAIGTPINSNLNSQSSELNRDRVGKWSILLFLSPYVIFNLNQNLLLCDQHSFFCAFLYFCIFKYSSSANTMIADLEKPLLLAKSTNIWCCSSVKLTWLFFYLSPYYSPFFRLVASVPLSILFVNTFPYFLKTRQKLAKMSPKTSPPQTLVALRFKALFFNLALGT